jgi:membrane-associated phospholipid phosphatase
MKKTILILLFIVSSQASFSQIDSDSSLKKPQADSVTRSQQDSVTKSTTDSAIKSQADSVTLQQNQKDSAINVETFLQPKPAYSPYTTSFLKDGLIITGTVGVTLLGYALIKNKKDLTMAELAMKTKDKLPFFDRGNAGFYSLQANKDSYILFDGSYAIPVIAALLNKKEQAKFGQVMVMYLETMAFTGSLYTITAGLVYRSRPFVYGDKAPLDKRLDKGGQRSFYGGHVATTAAATFFTAKVFRDFNPNSKLTPYLYGAAGGLTILMGYLRYQSGYHFLSDNILSGIIGTATGILIPQFHKNKNLKNLSLLPLFDKNVNGFSLSYRF